MDNNTFELILLARQGNAEAFGKLYEMYSKEMYCYACSMVKNPDLAQDAVQDTAMTAFKEIRGLRSIESFKGWLFRILNAACRRQYNKSIEVLPIIDEMNYDEDSDESYTEEIDNAELSMDMKAVLSILADDEKEIIMLKVVHEYNSREIADMLGISDSTVRSKLRRALEKLRIHMGINIDICA